MPDHLDESRGVGSRGKSRAEKRVELRAVLPHSHSEGRVVGATWSSDPDDCHFCKGEVQNVYGLPRGGEANDAKFWGVFTNCQIAAFTL